MAQTVTLEVDEADAPIVQAFIAKAQRLGKSITEMVAELRHNEHPMIVSYKGGAIVIHDQANYESLLERVGIAKAAVGIRHEESSTQNDF